MYIELKNDNNIERFHFIVKYAMLLWFSVSVMIAIYFYIYDTIDTYLWFWILVYFLLTAFIIYLFLVQLYILNPLIRVEIDYKNYIAKKLAEADAAKALLKQAELEQEQAALDRTMYVVVTVFFYFGFAFCCMVSVYYHNL